MVTKTKPPRQKKKTVVKPKAKPKAKKTTRQKVDEFVDAAGKIGTVANSASSVISLLETTGLLDKIKKALQDKKRDDETYKQLVSDLDTPANAFEPFVFTPVAQPTMPVAQPVVPVAQPTTPVAQPTMPVAQPTTEKDEFFTPRSSASGSITQLKLL